MFKIDLSKIFKGKKKEPNLLKQLLDNPENFVVVAYMEDDEIIMKIRKKS
jgi:hypothetical protein